MSALSLYACHCCTFSLLDFDILVLVPEFVWPMARIWVVIEVDVCTSVRLPKITRWFKQSNSWANACALLCVFSCCLWLRVSWFSPDPPEKLPSINYSSQLQLLLISQHPYMQHQAIINCSFQYFTNLNAMTQKDLSKTRDLFEMAQKRDFLFHATREGNVSNHSFTQCKYQ